jgi:hypothetical protein
LDNLFLLDFVFSKDRHEVLGHRCEEFEVLREFHEIVDPDSFIG